MNGVNYQRRKMNDKIRKERSTLFKEIKHFIEKSHEEYGVQTFKIDAVYNVEEDKPSMTIFIRGNL